MAANPPAEEFEGEFGNEDEIEMEEAGRVQPVVRRAAHEPTAEEIRQHRINHTPYRSWCPECVKGRAKDGAHRQIKEPEKAIPTMHVDY